LNKAKLGFRMLVCILWIIEINVLYIY
jgi:hypothetical protein